jgi:hypothetical protein
MDGIHKLIFFFLAMLIISFGCTDDPSELGAGLVSPTDTVQVQYYATAGTSDSTYLYRINGLSSTLIGIYETIEARSLLQFPSLSSIPDTAIIDSAILQVPLNYAFMDSLGHVAFDIHSLLQKWTLSTFTWDSALVSGFYSSSPEASFEQTLSSGDTAFFIPLGTLIHNWMEDSTDTSRGIIMIPRAGVTTTIAGAIDESPVLTISYRNDSGDTTHTLSLSPSQQTFVANGNLPSSGQHIFLQAGIGYRSFIRFDSLALPRSVSITEAVLEFTLDESLSLFNGKSRDTVSAHFLRVNTYPYDTIALGTVCSPKESGGKKIYQGNIKAIVQQWVIGTPNYGIILRPLGEYTKFDRFAIYGAASDSLRPKLSITYTVLP